jgi:hypothetical protein
MNVNESALFIPTDRSAICGPVTLSRCISAIQLVRKQDGGAKLGPLAQLGAGTIVELCGDGFNERTKKVRANGQSYFFVFREDLES